MLTRYVFRDDHGTGSQRLILLLDTDHMPICFETLHDWAMFYVEPHLRGAGWKLVFSEPAPEPLWRQESGGGE